MRQFVFFSKENLKNLASGIGCVVESKTHLNACNINFFFRLENLNFSFRLANIANTP